MNRRILYDHPDDEKRISDFSKRVIDELMQQAGVSTVYVTRTVSTPQAQAVAMLDNALSEGWESQRKLYGSNGDLVIDVAEAMHARGSSRDDILAAMVTKIMSIGPEKVSKHCQTPEQFAARNVIDLSSKRIPEVQRIAFERAVAADKRVALHFSPFTRPHSDPAFHLEIPQTL